MGHGYLSVLVRGATHKPRVHPPLPMTYASRDSSSNKQRRLGADTIVITRVTGSEGTAFRLLPEFAFTAMYTAVRMEWRFCEERFFKKNSPMNHRSCILRM